MFTGLSAALILMAIWAANYLRGNESGRPPRKYDDDAVRRAIAFARQDARLIALLLGAMIAEIGVVADFVLKK